MTTWLLVVGKKELGGGCHDDIICHHFEMLGFYSNGQNERRTKKVRSWPRGQQSPKKVPLLG